MNKPDRSKLKYNEKALAEAAKRPVLPFAEGQDWYPFEIVGTEEKIGETEKTRGDMVIIAQCAALKDVNRAGEKEARLRPLMRERITVPMGNPDWTGHTAPDYAYGMTEQRLLAWYDEAELPRPPRRENGKLIFMGEEIDKKEEDTHRQEVMRLSVDLAVDLYFGCDKGEAALPALRNRAIDVTDLNGRVFLGRVGPDRKTGDYVNILDVRHLDRGLPDGAGWGPAYEGDGGSAPASNGPAPARRTTKKKTTKKAGKKRGK